uniref:serine/threonine-protein kinase ppk25-like n=1 Tax=Styela clava TaxID=7725 RepID=UPI001939B2F8|nr:serine/threonine-protein kinase ppk25-like [Styela clava]
MARNFFVQIVNGVKYLHGKGVAHRDLKLENIILGEDGTIKLCDFGLACEFTPGGNDVTTGKCGTVHYAAPELKSSHSYAYRAQPADVWSLGAVLYVLCHRRKLKNKRSSECIQRKLELSSRLSDDCCDIIRQMLRCHPLERITVTEILNHPWMTINPDQEAKSRKLRMAPTLSTSSESVSVYSSRFKRPITSVHQRFGSGSSIASSSGSNILIKAAPEVGKNIYADYSTDPGNSRTIAQKPRRI